MRPALALRRLLHQERELRLDEAGRREIGARPGRHRTAAAIARALAIMGEDTPRALPQLEAELRHARELEEMPRYLERSRIGLRLEFVAPQNLAIGAHIAEAILHRDPASPLTTLSKREPRRIFPGPGPRS